MDIVLVHPQIPHNSGCAARLAAATSTSLHLVEPLGFSLEDRYLKRAGLDYWPLVDLVVHASWDCALEQLAMNSTRPVLERLKLLSARGGRSIFESDFEADDILVFGCETKGLPPSILALADASAERIYVPIESGVRSLNLANVVCLALYTAMDRAGMAMPDNDGSYVAPPSASDERKNRPQDVVRKPGTD